MTVGSPSTPIPEWDDIRRQMGYTLYWANRVDLGAMIPQNNLASTEYWLGNPGVEYLVYLPEGGSVIVDLSASPGELSVMWFDPAIGEHIDADKVAGGNKLKFTEPFAGMPFSIFNEHDIIHRRPHCIGPGVALTSKGIAAFRLPSKWNSVIV